MEKFFTKLASFVAVFAVAASSFGFSSSAYGAEVTSSNHGAWQVYTTTGGQVSFKIDPTAPGAEQIGALSLSTANDNDSRARFFVETNVPLSEVSTIGYSTKQLAGPVGSANPAIYLIVDANGDGNADTTKSVLYETYYNGTNEAGVWQNWVADDANGKFWSSLAVGELGANGNGGSYDKNFTLGNLKAAYPKAVILAYGVNMGSWNPGWESLVDNFNFNGTVYDFEPVTITNSEGEHYLDLQEAIDGTESNGTVTLNFDVVTDTPILVNKKVTIEGNGHTLAATADFAGGHVVLVSGDGSAATINKLVVDGAGKDVHGIQAYVVTDVALNDVTVQNNGKSGLLVNGSTVTATNLTTSGNGWNGVNVDQGSGVTSPATLTVNGTSRHGEADAIWIDSIAKTGVSVVDAANQYVFADRANADGSVTGRVYTLRPTSTGGSRSGGSRSNNTPAGEVLGDQTGPVGEVLGASAYNFTRDLTVGLRGDDVTALQAALIASGDLAIAAPTGYFGDLTKAAVAKWQARNGVPATGYFGPLSRAAFASAGTPAATMTAEQRAAAIAELLKKVAELQEKIKNL